MRMTFQKWTIGSVTESVFFLTLELYLFKVFCLRQAVLFNGRSFSQPSRLESFSNTLDERRKQRKDERQRKAAATIVPYRVHHF